MFPNISAMQIQNPVIYSEEVESESILTQNVKQSQIASVNLNGFGFIAQSAAVSVEPAARPVVPLGAVIPTVDAPHWSVMLDLG